LDVLPERLQAFLQPKFPRAIVIAEHAADTNYTIVGAASILAKVERDRAVKEIEELNNIKIGSGYIADPVTLEYIQSTTKIEPSKRPNFIRASWNLTTVIDPLKNNKSN